MGDNVLIAAQAKAGKTTLVMNLIKCMADGGDFLGTFAFAPIAEGRTITVIDSEMSQDRYLEWAWRLGIEHPEKVATYFARGRAHHYDITNPAIRAQMAAELAERNTEVLVLDPAAPFLAATGLDEYNNPDVTRWTAAVDALKAEAGIDIAIVVHHAGHEGTRARGASRWKDWPDSFWTIQFDEISGRDRTFRAYGRDVDVPEQELVLAEDRITMTLGQEMQLRPSGSGGGKGRPFTPADQQAVLDAIEVTPGIGKNEIGSAVGMADPKKLKAIIDHLVDLELVRIDPGPNRKNRHFLVGDGK